jgi:hypothetical protein
MLSCVLRPPIPSIFELLSQVDKAPIAPCPLATPAPDPGSASEIDNLVTRGTWSFEEDILLCSAINRYGTGQWEVIADAIPGRNPTQCRERWTFRIGPGINKSPFEPWEDELILTARTSLGNHWSLIAGRLPGRTSCAVKNRWYSVLRNRGEDRADRRRRRRLESAQTESWTKGRAISEIA